MKIQVDPTLLTSFETDYRNCVDEAESKYGYSSSVISMYQNKGYTPLDITYTLIFDQNPKRPKSGFKDLKSLGRVDLTLEALVLRHKLMFSSPRLAPIYRIAKATIEG